MAYFSTTTWSNDDANGDQPDIYGPPASRYSVGMLIKSGNELIDQRISQVEYYAIRQGVPSPSFTVSCKVWDSSDDDINSPLATSSTTYNSNSDIETTPTLLTFPFSNFKIEEGYVIGLYGDNSASSSDTVAITGRHYFRRDANNVSGTEWNTTNKWESDDDSNPQVRVTYSSGSTGGTRLPPPPLIARF